MPQCNSKNDKIRSNFVHNDRAVDMQQALSLQSGSCCSTVFSNVTAPPPPRVSPSAPVIPSVGFIHPALARLGHRTPLVRLERLSEVQTPSAHHDGHPRLTVALWVLLHLGTPVGTPRPAPAWHQPSSQTASPLHCCGTPHPIQHTRMASQVNQLPACM